MLQVYLLELYLRAGLNPFRAGLALAIAVAWDAVSDPLMGVISDRTPGKSPRGKRIPYFLAGSVLLALAFTRLYSPELGADQNELFAHLLFWYLILNTAMTLVGVPHLAMANDLSSDSRERTELFGWRLGFGGVGLLAGLSIPILIAGSDSTELSGFLENRSGAAKLMSVIALITCVGTAIAVWKPLGAGRSSSKFVSGRFWSEVQSALHSRPFRLLTAGFVFISLGRAFNSSLALLYYKLSLKFEENVVAGTLILFTVMIIISAPVWIRLARNHDKNRLCVAGVAALGLMTAIVYPLTPEGSLWPILTVAVIGGFLVACIALLESMISDVVEDERANSGMDLAGAYFGVWRMGVKVARAFGILISSWYLSVIGFEEGFGEQSDFVERAIAWGFGPGVGLFFGLGAWFISRAGANEAKV